MKVDLILERFLDGVLRLIEIQIAVLVRERVGKCDVHKLILLLSSKRYIEGNLGAFGRALFINEESHSNLQSK